MDKNEIGTLLKEVKVCYPRFDAVEKMDGHYHCSPEVIEAWHRRIGWMDLDRALKILDRYMESENGGKTPTLALWMNNGRAQARTADCDTAYLDRRTGAVIWTPEQGGPVYERKVTFNEHNGFWEDEEGYLWATAEAD